MAQAFIGKSAIINGGIFHSLKLKMPGIIVQPKLISPFDAEKLVPKVR